MQIDWVALGLALAWLDIAVVGSILIFTLCWHLYYKLLGRTPTLEYYEKYSNRVLERGGLTTLAAGFGIAALLFVSMIGFNVTARMPGAEVETKTSSFLAGNYVRTFRDSLPKANRKYIGKDDILFIETASNQGYRKVLLVSDKKLRYQTASLPALKLVEVRWILHYPASIFRWMGTYDQSEFVIVGPGGKQLVVGGDKIYFQTSVKS